MARFDCFPRWGIRSDVCTAEVRSLPRVPVDEAPTGVTVSALNELLSGSRFALGPEQIERGLRDPHLRVRRVEPDFGNPRGTSVFER